MSQSTYSLVFRGDLVAGYTAGDVKASMVRLFKSNPQAIEKLFSGRPLTLKKGLSLLQAQQFQANLAKIGAQVSIKSEDSGTAVTEQPKSKPETAFSSQWTLAPMEGNLVKEHERKSVEPVSVEVEHLSLRAAEGQLLDESERKGEEPSPVSVPNWVVN
ncbi:hypothetical protein BTJ40_17830 [Microbulbifer sp. A4B17]|uniref:hypothetical protein n=1 Tax=Microbulbifer sp. A4B17 TaxID=359370 RepID=UPI000D52E6E2|nr:hypothetical protein [Microbulbifer sp. A4B17]AWF82520.1 hypothetical protein BTJ40_17830 [Microbulbifer sp. A4B17]